MGFEADIKPLFRAKDRDEMAFLFDLWSYEDVRAAAEDILARVDDGAMPCDERWEYGKVRALREWIGEGCPP